MFASEDGDAAARCLETLSRVSDGEALPNCRIELPGEAARDFLQRMPRYPVDDVEIVAGLGRHQAKPRHGGGERRIDVVRLDLALGRTAGPIRRIDGRIDDHHAGEAVAVEAAGQHRHEAAETVRHDYRRL